MICKFEFHGKPQTNNRLALKKTKPIHDLMQKTDTICFRLLIVTFCLTVFPCQAETIRPNENSAIDPPTQETTPGLFLLKQSNQSAIDSSGMIIVADSILERRIKISLHIPENEPIPASIADTLTFLDVSSPIRSLDHQKIRNIDALVFFKNLELLNLNFNLIDDIRSLGHLKKLTVLSAQNNRIQDISVMKELKNLKWLNLSSNEISDISCLSSLTKLTDLTLWNNRVNNIKSLEELKKLTSANLGKNFIKDISPLKNCKILKELWLYGNPLANPEIISELGESLETLSIAKCNLPGIQFLENCTHLQTLVIFDNAIKDISVLHKMTQLYVFLASNNQIDNIDVLADLVDQGAFKKESRFRNSSNEIGTNINLTGNPIDYQLEKNQKIKAYLNQNVAGVKL